MVLHRTGAASETITYMKSAGAARSDGTRCTRVPTSLIVATMGGIKAELGNTAVVPYSSSVNIAFGDYLFLFRHRQLQWVSNIQGIQILHRRRSEELPMEGTPSAGCLLDILDREGRAVLDIWNRLVSAYFREDICRV